MSSFKKTTGDVTYVLKREIKIHAEGHPKPIRTEGVVFLFSHVSGNISGCRDDTRLAVDMEEEGAMDFIGDLIDEKSAK